MHCTENFFFCSVLVFYKTCVMLINADVESHKVRFVVLAVQAALGIV